MSEQRPDAGDYFSQEELPETLALLRKLSRSVLSSANAGMLGNPLWRIAHLSAHDVVLYSGDQHECQLAITELPDEEYISRTVLFSRRGTAQIDAFPGVSLLTLVRKDDALYVKDKITAHTKFRMKQIAVAPPINAKDVSYVLQKGTTATRAVLHDLEDNLYSPLVYDPPEPEPSLRQQVRQRLSELFGRHRDR